MAQNEPPQERSWVECPHVQARFRSQLEAAIPDIQHLEMDIECAACGDGADLTLLIVSDAFENYRPLDRQRLVFTALQVELSSGAIHSLQQLQTLTLAQWQLRRRKRHLAWVEERLREAVPIEHLEITDVTNGHAVEGFFDGSKRALDPTGLELQINVVSPAFEGRKLLDRQRLVADALEPELLSGKIHALPRMKAWTIAQWHAARAGGGQDKT